jgi:iron(III) transport system permease protein
MAVVEVTRRQHSWTRGLTRVPITAATITLVVFLVGYPLLMLIIGSFSAPRPTEAASTNIRAYFALFRELDVIWNTIHIAVGSTLLALVIGLSLAWILARTDVPFAATLEQLVIIPFYLSPLLGAIGWILLASPSQAGLVNAFFMNLFGLASAPLNIYSPSGIIWVSGVYFAPFCFLFAISALRSMDASLEESARINGSGNLGTAWKITFPLITPAILGSTLLVFVLAVGQFGVPAVLGMPRGYDVLTTRIYELVAGFEPDYAVAAAMGLCLVVFSSVGVTLQIRILGHRKFTTVTGKGYRPRIIEIGFVRHILFICVAAYVAVAVVLPLGALIYASFLRYLTISLAEAQFTTANYSYILFQYPTTQTAIRNTLVLAIGGATVTLLISFLAAWQIVRLRTIWTRFLEFIVMVPVAIPGIVFSLGLLWAWIAVPFVPVYGTIWILLICYVTIFVPYGVRSVSASLSQIDSSLEECALVCGARWGQVLRTILFPLLRPGLMAAWTLLFVSIVKELSASALLYNNRTIVLSVAVYDLIAGSSFPRVSALALIEAVLIFSVLWLARRIARTSLVL